MFILSSSEFFIVSFFLTGDGELYLPLKDQST
jgi:hypothetical protein